MLLQLRMYVNFPPCTDVSYSEKNVFKYMGTFAQTGRNKIGSMVSKYSPARSILLCFFHPFRLACVAIGIFETTTDRYRHYNLRFTMYKIQFYAIENII